MSKPDGDTHMILLAEAIANQASLLSRLVDEWALDPYAATKIDHAVSRAVVMLARAARQARLNNGLEDNSGD
jgi:hypothetical protein